MLTHAVALWLKALEARPSRTGALADHDWIMPLCGKWH